MVNILIIDDNIQYSRNLINFLSKNNPMIRLISMIADGKEAIDYLNSEYCHTDIILLDMKLPYYNGNEILKFLEYNEKDKYENSVIVISGEPDFLIRLKNNKYIYTYINKTQGFDKILKEVNDLINEKQADDMSIRNLILGELNYLNFNDNFVGTKYLLEAIIIIIEKYKFKEYNLNKDIYPILASKYNKSVNNIKCNINNATTIMNCDCERKVLMKYFSFCNNSSEAKPKQIIDTIIKKILI